MRVLNNVNLNLNLNWSEETQKKVKYGLKIFAIFAAGFLLARYMPQRSHRKGESDQAMVEKVSEDSLKISEETLKNLKISPVNFGEVPEQLRVMGKISVAEDKTSMVAARVGGRIESVVVASGAVVKAGDVLAMMFSPDFVIAREEYLQTLRQFKSTGDVEEKKVLQLSRQKLEAMGVTRRDIDNMGSEKSTLQIIRSPRDGAVIDKKAIAGNLVNPGDPLFTVGDTNSVWFAGDIYPSDLDKVHPGQEVVIDPDMPGKNPIQGKLSFVSPMVDANTRTIKVRAAMENPKNELKLDMYVRGNIILSEKTALTIPKGAIIREGNSYVCFKEFPNHIYKKIPIEVVGESDGLVIIGKGLEQGDRVVSDGALLLVSALSMSPTSNPDDD